MRTELIRIETPTHPLDGAYYTPDGVSQGAVMYCHGNQMNFYVCAGRCEVVIVPGCDHFYVTAEDKVSKIVADWLEKNSLITTQTNYSEERPGGHDGRKSFGPAGSKDAHCQSICLVVVTSWMRAAIRHAVLNPLIS